MLEFLDLFPEYLELLLIYCLNSGKSAHKIIPLQS